VNQLQGEKAGKAENMAFRALDLLQCAKSVGPEEK
jgi:hypothetical protein